VARRVVPNWPLPSTLPSVYREVTSCTKGHKVQVLHKEYAAAAMVPQAGPHLSLLAKHRLCQPVLGTHGHRLLRWLRCLQQEEGTSQHCEQIHR
jgi:hypothetical protein